MYECYSYLKTENGYFWWDLSSQEEACETWSSLPNGAEFFNEADKKDFIQH